MKNCVILLAGGVGARMNTSIPKQFLLIDNKPIIAYTIDRFEKNDSVDGIVVVCVKEWIEHLKKLISVYSWKKVKWVIEGGKTGHDSIRNGVFFLRTELDDEDFVIVHDAVRPIVPQMVIDDLLLVAHKNGNSTSSIVCHPPIVYTDDGISGSKDVDREHVMLTAAPQAFNYGLVYRLYIQAEAENLHNFTYTSSLLIHYGYAVFFSKGITSNIKITKKEDLPLFEALLTIPEERLME